MSFGSPISTTMKQVSVGSSSNIWGVDASMLVYKYTGSGSNWTLMPGSLVQVSAAADGTVWGVNALGISYQYAASGNHWIQIPGVLAQVSVGTTNLVWGVDSAGKIYQYSGTGNIWTQITGQMTQVSVGADGTVWGVNSGKVYRYGNNTWNQLSANTFGTSFTQVTAGSPVLPAGSPIYVRALDTQGNMFTYYGNDPWSKEGSYGTGIKYISLASDLTFAFIDSTGTTQLVPYNPSSPSYG